VPFRNLTLDELQIDDEKSFRHIALFDALKQVLQTSGYRFRVAPPDSPSANWDRALFLNLTFWDVSEAGDVLVDDHIAADVVAHVAWHALAKRAVDAASAGSEASGPSADGLLLGEAIASAFDLYLVGRLLGHAPDAEFLQTQVPAMADAAEAAGLSEEGFEELLQAISSDPDRAFEDLRELLFDAATALAQSRGIDEAAEILERFEGHRFAPLLHHYELSTWILSVRAYAPGRLAPDPVVRAIDAALRSADVALDWLESQWVTPALGA